MDNPILELKSVGQSFIAADGSEQIILSSIDFNLKEGEIVAVVGKSGCGKSTLLRIIAGLTPPSSGRINFYQKQSKQNFGISMIFQSFALFPWLTVLENVELGLEAMGIPAKERNLRALQAIDLIGLDGFESAYPRELSGGMKQRVGFARALVVNPEILLMDEPFSALDVLTSDTLKNDFLSLWVSKKTSLKATVIVTHSIEEAVMMADRVLVLGSNPGRISAEIAILLPRPRNAQSQEFHAIVDKIYTQMVVANQRVSKEDKKPIADGTIAEKLPFISPNQLASITSTLIESPYNGSANLSQLVKSLHLKTADIIHIAEALQLLKFASLNEDNISLNSDGRLFANADLETRKEIFAKHLLECVPLAAYIIKLINDRSDHKLPKIRLQSCLEEYMRHDEAVFALKTIIKLGRYAEIFAYDDDKQIFSLENPS